MLCSLTSIASINTKYNVKKSETDLSGSVMFQGSSFLNNTSKEITLNANWTIEAWIKVNSTNSIQCFFNLGTAANYVTPLVNDNYGVKHSINFTNTPTKLGDATGLEVVIGQWIHIAIVRRASNGFLAFYLNGKIAHTTSQAAKASYSTTGISLGKAFVVHRDNNNNFYVVNGGKLASFRVSKIERYTTNEFIPSKEIFVHDANTLIAYNATPSSVNLNCTDGTSLTNNGNCTADNDSP